MDTNFVATLANQSAAVILTFIGLYLFKVVVNDIKHDVESMRHSLNRMADLLERMERRSERDG